MKDEFKRLKKELHEVKALKMDLIKLLNEVDGKLDNNAFALQEAHGLLLNSLELDEDSTLCENNYKLLLKKEENLLEEKQYYKNNIYKYNSDMDRLDNIIETLKVKYFNKLERGE